MCFLLVGSTVFAQGNGQVSGSVQDPSKALIPGVTITLTNTATGVVSTQVSNESGVYSFASVPPGAYKLSGSLPGFKTAVFNDVTVGTSAQVRLNITMQLGEVASLVEVSVSAQQLLTESSASIGEVLTQQRVSDLPMVRGDVLDLVRIMPGMRVDPFGDQFSAFTGLPTNTINTTRDGLSVTDTRNNILSGTTTMSPDLVGEIRIILSPVDAEFGRGNGQIQIQTRSGSNKFTGTAVWNIRNSGLASNSWLNNRNIDPITKQWSPIKPDWRNTHDYTLSYGGPIIKNKTFFFALWDQQISRTRTTVTNNVLTDTARQGIFRYYDNWNGGDARATLPTFPASLTAGVYPVVDFAGNPVAPSKNPDGTNYTGSLRCYSVFGNTKADGTPFTAADCAGGVAMIGAAWDPLRTTLDTTGYIKKLLGAMPHANYWSSGAATVDGLNLAQFRWLRGVGGLSGGGGQNGTSPESVNRKQINVKIDHNLSTKHRLSAGWTYQADDNADNIAAWPGGFNGNSLRRPQVLTLNFTSTLSAAIVNEGRFGISYQYNEVNPAWKSSDSTVSNGASALLLQGGKNATTGAAYPVAFTPGAGNYAFGTNLINNNSTYSGSGSPLYNYADTLSWTRGSHAFRMGGELRLTRSNGYSGAVVPTATGGNGNNASPLVNAIAGLPNQLAANRTNAANMAYLLAGSVNSATMLYWVGSQADTKNGTWQDYVTADKRNRQQVANEWDAFFKDDWKVKPSLTLNLGVRYEFYGAPYLKGGYTASVIDQGAGLFGMSRTASGGLFDHWLSPGNIYLSGYGPNATAATALQCTSGAAQNAFLPTPNCDPTKLTGIEYVGPGSDHPDKTAVRNDRNNFGPAIGFAWQVPWFGKGKTSLRGGFSVTYGVGSQNAGATEGLIGNVPGSNSTATTNLSDFATLIAGHALNLADLPALVPVKPTSPALPGGQIPVYNRATAFTAYDPNFSTPFTENITLSITRTLTRNLQLDLRYDGTLGRKRQGSLALNTADVYYNKELFDALEMTRRGDNAPLFDQMFAGLNLAPAGTAGYGPVGTCVALAGAPGAGLEGCPAGQVMQHGSAHLRRNATFTANLANGNYNAIAGALNTLNAATVATGPGALQALPAGVTGVSGRVLRNGCDRIAANLYNPTTPTSATNIPTRCFAENYIVANPQLSTATYNANLGRSNYQSLQTQFTLRPFRGFSAQTTYIWAKTLGLVIGGYTDPLNRNADYAPPYQAVKHDLRTNGTFEVPIGPNKLLFANSSGWAARLIERWQMSFIANASSGNPRTIIGAPMFYATGNQNLDAGQNRVNIVSPLFDQSMKGHVLWNGPNNDTGTYYGSNKFTNVPDPQCALTNKTDTLGFNLFANGSCTLQALAVKNADGTTGPNLLQNPLPGTRGNMPFSLEAPGKWKFDINLGKTFRVTESKSLQVRMDAVNILNHPDIVDPDPQTGFSINSPGIVFGRIQTKSTGGTGGAGGAQRSFQGQLRFTF